MDGNRSLRPALPAPVAPRHRPRAAARPPAGGFTIVELIAVIVLLSILGVVAMARLPSPNLFAPAVLAQALISEARLARQIAASRHDAVVTLSVIAEPEGWRARVSTDVDGIIRSQLIETAGTTIAASSGAAAASLDATTPLTVSFDAAGRVGAITIGAVAGSPGLGLQLSISGDNSRDICLYASGYASDAACV